MLSAKLANGAAARPFARPGSERAAGRRAEEVGVSVAAEPGSRPARIRLPTMTRTRTRSGSCPACPPPLPAPREKAPPHALAHAAKAADAARRGDQAVAARDAARVLAAAVRYRAPSRLQRPPRAIKPTRAARPRPRRRDDGAHASRRRPDAAAGPRRPILADARQGVAGADQGLRQDGAERAELLRLCARCDQVTSRPRSSRRPVPCPQPTSRRSPVLHALPLLPSRPSRSPIRCRS